MDKELRQPCRTFTIRQLCQEFDCTPRALRFYEDKGLLSPTRDGMNRIYSYKDRGRLILILRGKRVGLALAEIRDLYNAGDGGEAQLMKSADKFRERVRALEEQKTDIDGAIEHLRSSIAFCERSLTTLRVDGQAPEDQYAPGLPRRMEGAEAK
ncbi:MAG: MerR family DNA-binding transcriptional regulator [Phenylobacterium sp.]|uniref:MerR family transcriptional regulator n=1 Tax=Phenylobacterium sp. TaxID=1871053 RepID=UPI002732ECD3|nr:MerR family DNA-binding transcriptional regulator [Phenylobacterium sp.]MDP3173472.1 MerR family DNA-binding transcriptional regulator [Phenylobacterium sp.]